MNHELLLIAELEAKQQDRILCELDPERRLIRTDWLATITQPAPETQLIIKCASWLLLALGLTELIG